MVNEIEELSKVIGSLEEQARQVNQFTGVLRAVNDAQSKIKECKNALQNLTDKNRILIEYQSERHEIILERFVQFDHELAEIQKKYGKVIEAIEKLSFVSPEQFQQGHSVILSRLSELSFVSPAQFQQGQSELFSKLSELCQTIHAAHIETRRAGEKAVSDAFERLTQQLVAIDQAQRQSLKSLRLTTIFGLIALAAGLAFIAYPLLESTFGL